MEQHGSGGTGEEGSLSDPGTNTTGMEGKVNDGFHASDQISVFQNNTVCFCSFDVAVRVGRGRK